MKKFFLGLFLAASLALASCGTIHKLTQKEHAKTDSVVHVVSDSSSRAKTDTKTHSFTASDITVDINYDSASAGDTTGESHVASAIQDNGPQDPIYTVIRDAERTNANAGHLPSSIHIHIGAVKDTSSHVQDTIAKQSHVASAASVQKNISTSTVQTTKKTLNGWIAATIGLIVLGSVVSVGIYLVKKYKLV